MECPVELWLAALTVLLLSGTPLKRLRRRWTVSVWCCRNNWSQLPLLRNVQRKQPTPPPLSSHPRSSVSQWTSCLPFLSSLLHPYIDSCCLSLACLQCNRDACVGGCQPTEERPAEAGLRHRLRLRGRLLLPPRPQGAREGEEGAGEAGEGAAAAAEIPVSEWLERAGWDSERQEWLNEDVGFIRLIGG